MSGKHKDPGELSYKYLIKCFYASGRVSNIVFPIDTSKFLPTKKERMGLKDWREREK